MQTHNSNSAHLSQAHIVSLRLITAILAAGLLAACGSGGEDATPTIPVEQLQTEAVATFAADLTSTALAMPTATPTETATPTPNPTEAPAATITPAPTAAGVIPTASCYGLTFVSDVTIPDNTKMTPGQKFTKTWRVRNSGSCDWQTGFKLNFTGGEAMGGSSISLSSAVPTGSEVNLSVDLTAPNTAATYRGNWRMANASGTYFGDEIYVQIVVGSSTATATPSATTAATSAPTATPTSTPTPTETATP
jgi:hypothetical protein